KQKTVYSRRAPFKPKQAVRVGETPKYRRSQRYRRTQYLAWTVLNISPNCHLHCAHCDSCPPGKGGNEEKGPGPRRGEQHGKTNHENSTSATRQSRAFG